MSAKPENIQSSSSSETSLPRAQEVGSFTGAKKKSSTEEREDIAVQKLEDSAAKKAQDRPASGVKNTSTSISAVARGKDFTMTKNSNNHDPEKNSVSDIDTETDPDINPDFAVQNDAFSAQDVPLSLPGIVDDAVSRQISRVLSRTGSLSRTETARTVKSIPKNFNPDLNLSDQRKTLILLFSALSGFLSPMSNVAFLPAVSNIANDFNTTGTIINASNAVYLAFMMSSPCIFSPLSDIYGRRPMFLICLFGYIVSSILVAVSQDLAMFFVFRCTTAVFGTAFFSVGAHVVGDIYPPVERGRKISINVLGSQAGIALGPILGGIIVTWASWRIIFFVLAGIGVFNMVGVFFLMPETSRETKMHMVIRETGSNKKFMWISFNPFRILQSLVYPNLILAALVSSTMLYSMYNLLTPIRYVVDPRFNLTSPVYGALFYLAPGMGFVSGAYFGGKYSDYTVKKWIKKRNGKRVAEDRCRALLVSTLFVMPTSVLIYGWCLEYKKGGYPVPVIALFVYGFAQTISFPAVNTYCVDSMPEIGGDAIGGNYFARYFLAIASSASCLPAIETIGVGWCCTVGAFVTFGGGIAGIVLVRKGAQWRKEALVKRGLRGENEKFN